MQGMMLITAKIMIGPPAAESTLIRRPICGMTSKYLKSFIHMAIELGTSVSKYVLLL